MDEPVSIEAETVDDFPTRNFKLAQRERDTRLTLPHYCDWCDSIVHGFFGLEPSTFRYFAHIYYLTKEKWPTVHFDAPNPDGHVGIESAKLQHQIDCHQFGLEKKDLDTFKFEYELWKSPELLSYLNWTRKFNKYVLEDYAVYLHQVANNLRGFDPEKFQGTLNPTTAAMYRRTLSQEATEYVNRKKLEEKAEDARIPSYEEWCRVKGPSKQEFQGRWDLADRFFPPSMFTRQAYQDAMNEKRREFARKYQNS